MKCNATRDLSNSWIVDNKIVWLLWDVPEQTEWSNKRSSFLKLYWKNRTTLSSTTVHFESYCLFVEEKLRMNSRVLVINESGFQLELREFCSKLIRFWLARTRFRETLLTQLMRISQNLDNSNTAILVSLYFTRDLFSPTKFVSRGNSTKFSNFLSSFCHTSPILRTCCVLVPSWKVHGGVRERKKEKKKREGKERGRGDERWDATKYGCMRRESSWFLSRLKGKVARWAPFRWRSHVTVDARNIRPRPSPPPLSAFYETPVCLGTVVSRLYIYLSSRIELTRPTCIMKFMNAPSSARDETGPPDKPGDSRGWKRLPGGEHVYVVCRSTGCRYGKTCRVWFIALRNIGVTIDKFEFA